MWSNPLEVLALAVEVFGLERAVELWTNENDVKLHEFWEPEPPHLPEGDVLNLRFSGSHNMKD